MPVYDFVCECGNSFEMNVALKDFDNPVACTACGKEASRAVTTVGVNYVGDGWLSKNLKVKKQMAEKGKRVEKKQAELPKMSLAPNVEGEQVDTWKEAQKLAKSKGKDTTSYEPLISKKA